MKNRPHKAPCWTEITENGLSPVLNSLTKYQFEQNHETVLSTEAIPCHEEFIALIKKKVIKQILRKLQYKFKIDNFPWKKAVKQSKMKILKNREKGLEIFTYTIILSNYRKSYQAVSEIQMLTDGQTDRRRATTIGPLAIGQWT